MATFECPFCSAHVDVALERVGQVLACEKCQRPFRADVPTGKLVERVEGEWLAASGRDRLANEKTILRVSPDPFRRAPGKTLTCAFLSLAAVGVGLFLSLGQGHRSVASVPVFLTLVVAILAILPMVWDFVQTRFETLTITDERSIWRRGILNKNVSEVQHDDIRNIQVEQDFTDQLLRVGTVAISSAGQDDMEIIVRGMSRPQRIVNSVREYQSRLIGRD